MAARGIIHAKALTADAHFAAIGCSSQFMQRNKVDFLNRKNREY
jgi:hypothetical protein